MLCLNLVVIMLTFELYEAGPIRPYLKFFVTPDTFEKMEHMLLVDLSLKERAEELERHRPNT